MTPRNVIREAIIANVTRSPTTKTNAIIKALTEAGIDLVGPDEYHGRTVGAFALAWERRHGFDKNGVATAIRALEERG